MQYILTQEEYDELRKKQVHELKLSKERLQTLCTKIANEMPVKCGWNETDGKIVKPWGCILSTKSQWYCDRCPVREICPNPHKEYSK